MPDATTHPNPNPNPNDDAAEVARLRAEVDRLRQQVAAGGEGPLGPDTTAHRRGGWWRTVVVVVLLVMVAVLAPLSIVATWANDEVGNTDRYVQTVTPLASDPAVQNAVITRITDEIFKVVDVQAVTQEAVAALEARGLPPAVAQRLDSLSAPLARGVRNFVTKQVTKLVESPAFQDAWVQANRQAHTQLVGVLTGKGTDNVSVKGGTVSVNLATVIESVKTQLVNAGFGLAAQIPTVNAQFTVLQSADLTKAQSIFRLLDSLARWLPFLALLLVAIAVYVARNRRKALIASALVVGGSMLLLGIALNVFRPVYLNAIDPSVLPSDAAGSIYDTLVGFIRLNLRAVLVVSLAVAIGTWLSGPGSSAVTTRRGLSGGMAWLRGGAEDAGLRTGRLGEAAYRWRTPLRILVIGVALFVYVLQAHPTGASTLVLLIITVLALAVVEFLARPPAATTPTTPTA
jgi:hypothetical protein